MNPRTVAQSLCDQLDAWGIRNIYGVPGDAILPLIDAISKHPRLNLISVKHESSAAFMASAEAKLMERIGVCIATSGPGVANLLNGLADAKSDQAPVLAITGQVDSFDLETDTKQFIDQNLLMAAIADYSGLVTTPQSCNDVLSKALRTALSRGTVTHVAFTKDLWQMPALENIRPPEPYLRTGAQSPPEVITEVIRRMNEAERPAILAGRGIKHCGAQLLDLAACWQAGVCLTMAAKGLLPKNHLIMGGLGEGGSEASTAMLSEADLILITGATWWPEHYVPSFKRLIQLDAVPENIGSKMPVEYGVVYNLSELLPQITAGIDFKPKTAWLDKLYGYSNKWQERLKPETEPYQSAITPGYLLKTLEKAMEPDAVIALDVGDHTVWFNRIFEGERQEILISGTWRTMGFGLPAAISAKLCQPGRQVAALIGDGGLALNMGDFLTAVRYQLPIVVLVVNNGYLAMEKDQLELLGLNSSPTAITNADFAKFAECCGGAGFRVEHPGDLKNALNQAFSSNRPTIVDVITSPVKFPGAENKKEPFDKMLIPV